METSGEGRKVLTMSEQTANEIVSIFFGVGVIFASLFVYFLAVMVAQVLADIFRRKP